MCPLHIDLFVKGVPQKVREISRDGLPSHLPQSKSLPYLSPTVPLEEFHNSPA